MLDLSLYPRARRRGAREPGQAERDRRPWTEFWRWTRAAHRPARGGDAARAAQHRLQRDQHASRMPHKRQALIAEMREVGQRITELGEPGCARRTPSCKRRCWKCRTCPTPRCPSAGTSSDNVVVRTWGEPRTIRLSRRCPIGSSARAWASSTSSAASRSRARAFTSSTAPGRGCSAR